MSQTQFRLKRPELREADVVAACLDLLRVRGYYPVRIPTGLFRTADGRWVQVGEKGIPDYVAVHGQHPAFFLELKRPGGKPKPHQERQIFELRLGYRLNVAVVDSAAGLRAWLDAHEGKAQ